MDSAGADKYIVGLVIVTGILVLAIGLLLWMRYQLHQAKKNLQQLTDKLNHPPVQFTPSQNADESLILMVKTIAHDLRSPLNAIMGLTSLVEKSTTLSKDDLELVKLISRSSTHAQALTNRLLEYNYSVMEKGKSTVVNLHDFLTKITTLVQVNAFGKQQEIDFRSFGTHAANINTESMWQVMDNLIGNAIKFSPVGSSIVVRLAGSRDGRVSISVIDRGIGVPPEFVPELFKPLSKVRRPGTVGEKSFGLGLAICKQVVEAHDGSIHYETNQGKGSIFTVELPSAPINLVQAE